MKVKMKKTNPESNRDRYDRFRSHRINLLNWSVVPGPPNRSSGSQVAIQQLQDARPDARSHLLAFLLGTRESSYRTTVASKTGWKIGIPVIAWYEFMIVKLISLMYTYVQSPINQLVQPSKNNAMFWCLMVNVDCPYLGMVIHRLIGIIYIV